FQPVRIANPAAVGTLLLRQRLGDVLAPVVLDVLGVLDVIDAERVQALGHRVIVVVKAPFRPLFRHARIGIDAVVVPNPLVGFFDAFIILADAAVDEALDPGVGHAAVAWQFAVRAGLVDDLGDAARRRGVDEAAVVDLAGPGLVVGLA